MFGTPLTDMERKATLDARRQLFEALTVIGCINAFDNATPEQMCLVIEAVWGGVRDSMQKQAEAHEIPF